jgi:hypothetical protein
MPQECRRVPLDGRVCGRDFPEERCANHIEVKSNEYREGLTEDRFRGYDVTP